MSTQPARTPFAGLVENDQNGYNVDMQEMGQEKHNWKPLEHKEDIQTEKVFTKDSQGIHGEIIQQLGKNQLENECLNAQLDIPEDLLLAIRKRDELEEEKINIEKQEKFIPKQEKPPDEDKNLIFYYKMEIEKLKDKINVANNNIDIMVGDNKKLQEKYTKLQNIKLEIKKFLTASPKLN